MKPYWILSSIQAKKCKPLDKLVSCEQTRRLRSLAPIELNSSRVDMKALDEDALEIIHKNRDLAFIMNTVVDGVCDQVSRYMDINFDEINGEICIIYDINGSPEGPEVVTDNDNESRGWRLSTLLSSKSTLNCYNRLRTNLTKELKLSKDNILSYYHFNQRRLKKEEFFSSHVIKCMMI